MMSCVRLAVVALPAVGRGVVGIVDALDCDGRLVTMGTGPWDVQTICGDPVQVSDTVEVVLKPVYTPQGHVAGHPPVGESRSRSGPITSGRRGSCIS